jgi:hypothetical protein
MSDPRKDEEKPKVESPHAVAETDRRDEHLEDEEKILAGRSDVNLPALLTKDVQGG